MGYQFEFELQAQLETKSRGGSSASQLIDGRVLAPQTMRYVGDVYGHAYAMPAAGLDADGFERRTRDLIVEGIMSNLDSSVDEVSTRLQAADSKLFDAVDRLRAESSFRIGVSTPLAVLGVALAAKFSMPLAPLLVLVAVSASLATSGQRVPSSG